jgi:dTDP-4-dehydrorhamnose 3,5-epimerase
MEFQPTRLSDVVLIRPETHSDDRGSLTESFRADLFARAGLPAAFVQENLSVSRRGTLRGLHYQLEYPQGKLIAVLAGEIYDVAVDLRRRSPTFGEWVGVRLAADGDRFLWIPPGFAHGLYALTDPAVVVYKMTERYAPAADRTILWSDPRLAIDWPLLDDAPRLSAKDASGVRFEVAEVYG